MTTPARIGWPLIWCLLFMALLLLEGLAIGQHQPGDTLSELVRRVRFDPIGRPAFLVLWCWLTYHFVLRPRWDAGIGWRDAIAIAVGVAWAVWEARVRG